MSLLLKLLQQEKDVIDLIERDPWRSVCASLPDGEKREDEPPKYIRIEKYLYKFYDHRKDPVTGNEK